MTPNPESEKLAQNANSCLGCLGIPAKLIRIVIGVILVGVLIGHLMGG